MPRATMSLRAATSTRASRTARTAIPSPPADWTPGTLGDLPAGWQYAWDSAAPTCRLLNQPYSAGSSGTQFYVIDGFILSPNVEPVSVRTQDAEFAVTDHNPVVLEARLVS